MAKEKNTTKNTEEEKGELKTYELGFLLIPEIAEEAVSETILSEISSKIEKKGGKVTYTFSPEMKKLAYPIAHKVGNKNTKYRDAYFASVYFDLDAESVVSLSTEVKNNPKIIRSLLVFSPKKVVKTAPSDKPLPKKDDKDKEEVVKDSATEAEIDEKIEDILEAEVV